MSSCDLIQEKISQLLDGDLSPQEREEVEAHIQDCPSCAAIYQAFSLVSAGIAENLEEPPRALFENVMDAVRQEKPHRRVLVPVRYRSAAAAAACVALVLGLSLGLPPMVRSLGRSAASVQDVLTAAPTEWIGTSAALPEKTKNTENPDTAAVPEAEEPTKAQEPSAQLPPMEHSLPSSTPIFPPRPSPGPDTRTPENPDVPDPTPTGTPILPPSPTPTDDPIVPVDPEDPEDPEEPEPEEVDLTWMDLEELRAALGGAPAGEESELFPEEIPQWILSVLWNDEAQKVAVYETKEGIYYLDPESEYLWRSDLSPEEFYDFLCPPKR